MQRPLKVLFTNNTLASRCGSELYVRDVALGLLERGHTPLAYSTVLGEVAEELRRATAPVVQDLAAIASPPDIIHGQHHLETMTALLHFPHVPAVFFCHGWTPWEEMPPRFPRIFRYVAVDELCRERLVYESGIAENRVEVLLNFVDLRRFQPRAPLPERPRRALVFSNYANEESLTTIRRACAVRGLALDVIGLAAGTACARPENALGQYDLVFAKARCALEALAVGAAVVLCDRVRLGPLVTAAEMDGLRRLNFGVRCLREPITSEGLLREIDRYDPADAAEATRRIRMTAGREAVLDRLESLYAEVIDAHAAGGDPHPEAEFRAAGAYLRTLSPVLKQSMSQPLGEQCARLREDLAQSRLASQSRADECARLRQELALSESRGHGVFRRAFARFLLSIALRVRERCTRFLRGFRTP